jgi:S-adenosylmethionine:tRNA ribosyltransferase-isomerase
MGRLAVELPSRSVAQEPPVARGLRRDGVAPLVACPGQELTHARCHALGDFLAAADLLVVNASATLPAALTVRRADGSPLDLRLCTPAPRASAADLWLIELRPRRRAVRRRARRRAALAPRRTRPRSPTATSGTSSATAT